ncbi:MAG: Na+/H+ antiporter [Chloroflexota bacterium]
MNNFLSTETLIIELLIIVTLVAIAVRRLRVPYTVALVLVGLALTAQNSIRINLTPELILSIFVPPLVFEAALHINFSDLHDQLTEILLLAVPGIIITTLMVGGLLNLFTPLALPIAIIFGALISATDPVAVVAMFRTMGVSKKLAVLVESESLLNDGTAIVAFNIALMVAASGHFSFINGVSDFLRISVGGTAIGLVFGWLVSNLIARIDDYLIETSLTTILAFGVYILAEDLHFSGVLAVVAAGLVTGNLSPKGMSPTTRIVITNFWEYVAFLANSLVFLIIGLQINLSALLNSWKPVLIAIATVVLVRAVVVYGMGLMINRFSNRIPTSWLHVINWSGLRGAIALALVASLPSSLGPERELLSHMAFGVVLFTLLVQSTSMNSLIHRLKLITRTPEQIEFERRHARLTAARASMNHLERRHSEGLISSQAWEIIKVQLSDQLASLSQQMKDVLTSVPDIHTEELASAQKDGLRAQMSTLLQLRHDGIISQDVFEELSAEVNSKLDQV